MQKVTKELLDSVMKGEFAIEDPEFNRKSDNVNNLKDLYALIKIRQNCKINELIEVTQKEVME